MSNSVCPGCDKPIKPRSTCIVYAGYNHHPRCVPIDPRDAELAALCAQLADAMKVIEAAREWHRADYGSATEFIADAGLNDAVIEYNAKHGAK